jgi:hypothetical protein
MRGLAKLLAVLLLALGPVALTSVSPAQADSHGDKKGRNEKGRDERRGEGRQAERRGGDERDRGAAYPAPVYRAPAPYGGGYAPYPAYPSAPAYGEPPP